MRCVFFIFSGVFSQEIQGNRKKPLNRLANIEKDFTVWVTDYLSDFPRLEMIQRRSNNLFRRMDDFMKMDCFGIESEEVDQEEIEEENALARSGAVGPIKQAKKWLAIVRRVNRTYLSTCKHNRKNKRMTVKLALKVENAFLRMHSSAENEEN
jgi:hypothetical protein